MKIITSQRKTETLETKRKEYGPEKKKIKIKICKPLPINNYSNVNGLNSPIKRQRTAAWGIKKKKNETLLDIAHRRLTLASRTFTGSK